MALHSLVLIFALGSTASASLAPNHVIGRVVELIVELKAKVEADGKAEQKMYDKYACWCEETSKTSAEDIHQGMADIKRLSSEILGLKGTIATAISEIREHSKAILANQKAQDEATSIRQKNNAEFSSEKAG